MEYWHETSTVHLFSNHILMVEFFASFPDFGKIDFTEQYFIITIVIIIISTSFM